MKIVITVSDFGAAANVGGVAENRSAVIYIPEIDIPEIVKKYFKDTSWKNISFSLLDDGTKDPIKIKLGEKI